MSKKSKSRSNPLAELDFVASVQLEEAVGMIADIADKQHQVTLTEVSENEFKFQIDYLPNHTKEGVIWGTLQRWQGTDTKIDASGYVIRLADTDENGQLNDYASSFIVGFIVFFSFILIISGAWVCGLPMLLIAFFVKITLDRYSSASSEKSTVSFRARDYLLQRMIDTFKSDEDVEVYVPEISKQAQASGKS